MTPSEPDYFAYLLRLWTVTENGKLIWLASLEDPLTSERKGFSSIENLYAFLEKQISLSEEEKARNQVHDSRDAGE